MSSFTLFAPSVKPDRHPAACQCCAGHGCEPTACGELVPCSRCDGSGREPRVILAPAPAVEYLACSADAVVDADVIGCLKDFVDGLLRDWSLQDEEIAVWERSHQRGPRIVCVLRPGPCGKTTVVTYL